MTAPSSLRSWATSPEPAYPAALTTTAQHPGQAPSALTRTAALHVHTHTRGCTHTHTWAHTHTWMHTHAHMGTHTHRGVVCFQASRPPLPPDAHTRTRVHTHAHTRTHVHTHTEAWFASRLLDLPSLLTSSPLGDMVSSTPPFSGHWPNFQTVPVSPRSHRH